MKLRLMSLLVFFMAVPILGEASNVTVGTEFKGVRQRFKTKTDEFTLKQSVKGKFGLIDLFLGAGPEVGLSQDYLLGIGWKTDMFYGKSRINIKDTTEVDDHHQVDLSDNTRNEGANYDEMYFKFGKDFTPHWRGSMLFNYTQYSQKRSPSANNRNLYYQYEDKAYGLEGRMEYSRASESKRFEYGAGAGVLLQRGKTKGDLFRTSLVLGGTIQEKFKYWNLGGSVDAFAGYNITDRISARVSYKFTYSSDLSTSSEKFTKTFGKKTFERDVSVSGNEKIDNSFRLNFSYRF